MESVRGQLEFHLSKLVLWHEWLSLDLAAAANHALHSHEQV
jgi:hypothetical protein